MMRLIQSARTRGNWKGPIAVITTTEESPRQKDYYANLVQQDALVYLVKADNHNNDEASDGGGDEVTRFNNRKQMQLARHKSRLLDYITRDARLKDTEFVLYLDTDFIIHQPLVPWIAQKWNEGRTNRRTIYSNFSSLYTFQKGPTGRSANDQNGRGMSRFSRE